MSFRSSDLGSKTQQIMNQHPVTCFHSNGESILTEVQAEWHALTIMPDNKVKD